MSWYSATRSESGILAVATNLIIHGWRDAGYNTILQDAGWCAPALSGGHITWDTNTYPNGVPRLISHLAHIGFKFGLYCENTTELTQGWAGVRGRYVEDTQAFADWGVAYVKFDFSGGGTIDDLLGFCQAVDKTKRPMFVHWGTRGAVMPDGLSLQAVNSFRRSMDSVGPGAAQTYGQWLYNLESVLPYAKYVRPGFYLDLETIPLYLGSTFAQGEWLRGIISVQAILSASMQIACINDAAAYPTHGYAMDRDMIAINQDVIHGAGQIVKSNENGVVFVKQLSSVNGAFRKAACLWNNDTNAVHTITLDWAELGVSNSVPLDVYECWFKTSKVAQTMSYRREIPAGSAALLRLTDGNNFTNAATPIPLTFEVSMGAAMARGTFAPDLGDTVEARGSFLISPDGNWLGGFALTNHPATPLIFRGTIVETNDAPGSTLHYQFVINGSAWETSGNRLFTLRNTNATTLPLAFFNNLRDLGPLSVTQSGPSQIALTWTGGPLVRLQSSTRLSNWVDVPNTQGQSSTRFEGAVSHTFFRLVGP